MVGRMNQSHYKPFFNGFHKQRQKNGQNFWLMMENIFIKIKLTIF